MKSKRKSMKHNYLLKTQNAKALYEDYAKNLPIIDFHNHISVNDIARDRQFEDLTELWLTPDPYKHRLMRICGVPEHYITGSATSYEKFEKFCEVFPMLAGNPVYGGYDQRPIVIDLTTTLDGEVLSRKMYTYNENEALRRGTAFA